MSDICKLTLIRLGFLRIVFPRKGEGGVVNFTPPQPTLPPALS